MLLITKPGVSDIKTQMLMSKIMFSLDKDLVSKKGLKDMPVAEMLYENPDLTTFSN